MKTIKELKSSSDLNSYFFKEMINILDINLNILWSIILKDINVDPYHLIYVILWYFF